MQQPSLLLVLLPSLVLPAAARAEIVERVVAKVNGDIVTLSDFQSRQLTAAQAARVGPDRVEAFLRQNNARILQDAIDELLLTQRADELGMKAPPQAVREIIDNIKKENKLETDAELEEQLRREGMTMDDLRRSIGRSMLRRYVLQREIEPKVAVSEEDSYAEYQAKKAEYTKPETVTLEEILVVGEDAEAKAQALVGRARGDEDFGALARAYSQAPSAKNGGELGRLARGELSPELEKRAFALTKGAVSDPIPQGEGYRILKVVEKTETHVVPYDEAKKEIRQKLGEQRIQKEYEDYLKTLRDKAIVSVMVREVPLQLSGPVPENVLLDTPLLGGGAGAAVGGPPAPSDSRPEAPATPAPAATSPATTPATRPAAGAEDEISTTPQAAPERVAPPPLPGAEKKDEKKPEPPPQPPQS
jgi:parvulin-like peptidyl-prolyl isomerase